MLPSVVEEKRVRPRCRLAVIARSGPSHIDSHDGNDIGSGSRERARLRTEHVLGRKYTRRCVRATAPPAGLHVRCARRSVSEGVLLLLLLLRRVASLSLPLTMAVADVHLLVG